MLFLQARSGYSGLTLDKLNAEIHGTTKKVIISLDDTIVLRGQGDKRVIEERCGGLHTAMDKSTSLFDKENAQERLPRISGGVALLCATKVLENHKPRNGA